MPAGAALPRSAAGISDGRCMTETRLTTTPLLAGEAPEGRSTATRRWTTTPLRQGPRSPTSPARGLEAGLRPALSRALTHGPAASAEAQQVRRLHRAMMAESLLGGEAEETMPKNNEGMLHRAMRAVSFPAMRPGISASRAKQAPAPALRDNHLPPQRAADRLLARTRGLNHAD
jgi:hypothetical protein